MGVLGTQDAIDKQAEENAKKREKIEARPIHLGTRLQESERSSGGVTEQETRWREGVISRKRKWEDEAESEESVECIEWSFRGEDFSDGVDFIKRELKPGDFIELVVVDVSGALYSRFATSDRSLQSKLLKKSIDSEALLEDRRFKELRETNLLLDSLHEAFPRAKLRLVYDHPRRRSIYKANVEEPRMERAGRAKGAILSRQAVEDFKENDGKEKSRRENLRKNGPPQILMQDPDRWSLPAFAPPNFDEMVMNDDSTPLALKITQEATRIVDRADLVVSSGEADAICRDVHRLQLSPEDPRIESFTSARNPPRVEIEIGPGGLEEDAEEAFRGKSIVYGIDSDHAVMNDDTSFNFWFSSSPSITTRVVNFEKRRQHSTNWIFSSIASSTMAMVIAGCDLSPGLPGFTVHGIGTRKPQDRRPNQRELGESIILDICEHAIEWRDAFHRSYEAPQKVVTVTIDGKPQNFHHSSQLAETFDKLLRPLFRPTSTSPTFNMSLAFVIQRFEVLYGEIHHLQEQEATQHSIESRIEQETNAALKTRYATPNSRNHLFEIFSSPQPSTTGPPIATRNRRSRSIPPSWRLRPSLPSLSTPPRPRRNSVSTGNSPPPVNNQLNYQRRLGPDGKEYLEKLYKSFDDWSSAVGIDNEGHDHREKKVKATKDSTGKGKAKGKGKGKEKEKNEGLADESKEGGETIPIAKAVKGGAKGFGMAVSTIQFPLRAGSFNDLIFSGLPSQQHFHHAFQGVSLDMLNVWLSECPAILDLVHLLFALYYRFSPTLLIQLFNRGGQKFGDVIAGLVTRTSHYYDEFPLKTDPTPGDSFARDQAPEWLKTRVDAVLPLVPADRQPELWDLVNSLRFSKVDVELLKTTKEFNLFGMIVVKLRRLLKYPPPLIRHYGFLGRNLTVCGTSISNAAIVRGQGIHRTVAIVILDKVLDFTQDSSKNPYRVDSTLLSSSFASLSPFSKRLLPTISTKKLKRLISLQVYSTPLPDAHRVVNQSNLPSDSDDDDDSGEEEEEEEKYRFSKGREMLRELMEQSGIGEAFEAMDFEKTEEEEDVEFEPLDEEEDDAMEVDMEEDSRCDEFGRRLFQLVRTAAPGGDKERLSSEELGAAIDQITNVLVAATHFFRSLLCESYVEAVRSLPNGETLKAYRTVAELVVAGGGKEEVLNKTEREFLKRQQGEEEEKEKEESEERENEDAVEEVEESTRFQKNAPLSLLMRMSIEVRLQGGLPAFNFEPDGFHTSPSILRTFCTPSNNNFLPKLVEELFHRQASDSVEFNKIVREMKTSALSRFEIPSNQSRQSSPLIEAITLLRSLLRNNDKKFVRGQLKTPEKVLFPVLHDYYGLNFVETSSDGVLPIRKLSEQGRQQLKDRSDAVFGFIQALGITTNDELDELSHEFWMYVLKPEIGAKKLYHGEVYITREKISPLVLNSEKYTRAGLSKAQRVSEEQLGARETLEKLLSAKFSLVALYLKLEGLRRGHLTDTGESEIISVRRHRVVEGGRTVVIEGRLTRSTTLSEIVPFPPLLRPTVDPSFVAIPNSNESRFVLQFVKPLDNGIANPPPSVDDRRSTRLYLNQGDGTTSQGQTKWREWTRKNVEDRVDRPKEHSTTPRSSIPRPPPPPFKPIASTSGTRAATLDQSASPSSFDQGPNRAANSWLEDTRAWLETTQVPFQETILIGIDRGRVYKLVAAVVRVGGVNKVEFYRLRSSGAAIRERDWNQVLKELKPFEARDRLARMLQGPHVSTTDLSLLFRRSFPPLQPSGSATTSNSDPSTQTWFPSQTSKIPPGLQGALLHSPDYLATTLNTLERQRVESQIDSDATNQWRTVLPRPNNGGRYRVAIVRSTTDFAGFSKTKGQGRDDSRRYEDALVNGIRSIPWIDSFVVECSEANSSRVCSSCRSSLLHPCRLGDPLVSKILRIYICLQCIKVLHRDDNGALNILSIALGIGAVGKGNFLADSTAELVGNSNRLSKTQTTRLENALHRCFSTMDLAGRRKFVEGLDGKKLDEILSLTVSKVGNLEGEEDGEGGDGDE